MARGGSIIIDVYAQENLINVDLITNIYTHTYLNNINRGLLSHVLLCHSN